MRVGRAVLVVVALAACGGAGDQVQMADATSTSTTGTLAPASRRPVTTSTTSAADPTTTTSTTTAVATSAPAAQPRTDAAALTRSWWTFTSVVVDGESVPLGSMTPTLRFTVDDGELHWVIWGCNGWGGIATVDDDQLQLTAGGGSSAAGCAPEGQRVDDALHRLSGEPLRWRASDTDLHLERPDVVADLVATRPGGGDPLDVVVLAGEGWELGYRGSSVVWRGDFGFVSFAIPGEPFDGALGEVEDGAHLLFAVLPHGAVRATFTADGLLAQPIDVDVHPAPNDHRMAAEVFPADVDADAGTVIAYDADGAEVGRRFFGT